MHVNDGQNSSRPRILPCGTPDNNFNESEPTCFKIASKTTYQSLSVMKNYTTASIIKYEIDESMTIVSYSGRLID